MGDRFLFEGRSYERAALSAEGRETLDALHFVQQRLHEAEGIEAALIRARNSYIAELRGEIVCRRSGVDLGALLDGD